MRKVGKGVKDFKEGDRVCVGAQIDACGKCRQCGDNQENYCPEQVRLDLLPCPSSLSSRS